MATQTNPKINCSFCKKLLTQRHFFHHLHTSHHADLWTPSNKKVLERAAAKDSISDLLLEIKGYDSLFYLSPFSQRLYTKVAAVKNDYKKHNNDRAKYKELLTSLLSSSPSEKKTVTVVHQITPAEKDELLALKKLLALMAKELMLERREVAEKQIVIDTYKAKLVESGMTEEEVDDLEPLCDAEPEVFDYKTDRLTKKHAQFVKSFDLSDLEEIEKAKYSETPISKPQPAPQESKPTDEVAVCEPSPPPPSHTPPASLSSLDPPSAPADTSPELSVSSVSEPVSDALPLLQDNPPPKPVSLVNGKKQPKRVVTAAQLPPPEPAPQPPQSVLKKPPPPAAYPQFVYREPVPQFPKILQTSKRM